MIYKILFFICLISIEFLATTTVEIELVESMWDKFNHLMAFFVLYILISLAYKNFSAVKKIIWLLLFAVQIEIVQYFIEGRFFSLLDIVADLIGVFFGMLIYGFIAQHHPKIHQNPN